MSVFDPNLGLQYDWAFRESGWKPGMDANLKRLGAVVQLSVISNTMSAPPVSPDNGDRYIVAAGGSGAWAGEDDNIAVRIEDEWEFHEPEEGWRAWVVSIPGMMVYTGGNWTTEGAAAGTWQNPSRIAGWRLWDNGGVLRAKHGADPSSATDGDRVYMTSDGPGPSF